MHRVKIHWQGAAGQWPEREMTTQQTRSQRGLLGNRTSLMQCFILYIKGLCSSLYYSTLLKRVVRYQTKQLFWLSCHNILHWIMQLFPSDIFKRFMNHEGRRLSMNQSDGCGFRNADIHHAFLCLWVGLTSRHFCVLDDETCVGQLQAIWLGPQRAQTPCQERTFHQYLR